MKLNYAKMYLVFWAAGHFFLVSRLFLKDYYKAFDIPFIILGLICIALAVWQCKFFVKDVVERYNKRYQDAKAEFDKGLSEIQAHHRQALSNIQADASRTLSDMHRQLSRARGQDDLSMSLGMALRANEERAWHDQIFHSPDRTRLRYSEINDWPILTLQEFAELIANLPDPVAYHNSNPTTHTIMVAYSPTDSDWLNSPYGSMGMAAPPSVQHTYKFECVYLRQKGGYGWLLVGKPIIIKPDPHF